MFWKNKKKSNVNHSEESANRYVMRCMAFTIAVFFLIWVLDMLGIFVVDRAIMSRGFFVSLGTFAILSLAYVIIGASNRQMKYWIMFLTIALTTIIGSTLTYHTGLLSVLPLIYALMYSSKRVMIFTYSLTVVSIFIIVFVGYYHGLCDANMALLTMDSLRESTTADGVFALRDINQHPALTLTLFFAIPRCIVLFLLIPVCNHICKMIRHSSQKAAKMKLLADMDGMTGMYNRNKYLRAVCELYENTEKIAVIFWDINALKYVNDNMGHEYGDQLIRNIAESIHAVTTEKDKTYRIGGDEFVMIIQDGDEATAKEKIAVWEQTVAEKSKASDYLISASVGYACGTGKEIEAVIQKADAQMYENKRIFHENIHQR